MSMFHQVAPNGVTKVDNPMSSTEDLAEKHPITNGGHGIDADSNTDLLLSKDKGMPIERDAETRNGDAAPVPAVQAPSDQVFLQDASVSEEATDLVREHGAERDVRAQVAPTEKHSWSTEQGAEDNSIITTKNPETEITEYELARAGSAHGIFTNVDQLQQSAAALKDDEPQFQMPGAFPETLLPPPAADIDNAISNIILSNPVEALAATHAVGNAHDDAGSNFSPESLGHQTNESQYTWHVHQNQSNGQQPHETIPDATKLTISEVGQINLSSGHEALMGVQESDLGHLLKGCPFMNPS